MKQLVCWLVLVCLHVVSAQYSYKLTANYSGSSFFDAFSFFTANDPTNGYVNYVSEQQAQEEGLIAVTDGIVTISCDSTNVSTGRGRNSVRIQSNDVWNTGLFVLDLNHMPQGCATWPAFWLCGPDWPNNGEIDIIEGVNTQIYDQTTLHTQNGCNMSNEGTNFTGTWGIGTNGNPSTNCYINAPNQYTNQGCGIIANQPNYGSMFNYKGGGVYALQWTDEFIKAFFFFAGQIPADLQSGKPDPSTWGLPYAYFELGSNCPSSFFDDLQIIINLTFCGDWAAATFSSQCPGLGSCNGFVQNNPAAFAKAFWSINYLAVFVSP